MNLFSILFNGVIKIVSFLSIFFDYPKKRMTLKVFVIFVLIFTILLCLISSCNTHSGDESLNDEIPTYSDIKKNDEKSESNSGSSNSETIVNSTPKENKDVNKETHDEVRETNNNSKDILKIDSIICSTYNVDCINNLSFEIQPTNILELAGEISIDGQTIDYEYVPQISGTYRFEFSNVPNGTDLRLGIYNSGWEQIKTDYDFDNGDGLTSLLSAGETYYIRVEQYREIGPYTLNIGQKKEIVDITNYTEISDSIQYTDQENDYFYVAENEGVYRFEFSNVPNGTDLRLSIYNSGWEQIKTDYDLDNGDGLTVWLSAGETYYIRVEQYREVGSYTLNVGSKKEIVDITNYTEISDSIQYTNQENDYSYIAKNEGTYRFEFSNVPNGTDLRLGIYNSGWEQIKTDYDLDNGDGLTVWLSAGETYYIRVEQYKETGSYTLNVGSKKEIVDITNYAKIRDSIQYTDQENDYSYVAKNERTYRFEFSNIPEGCGLRMEIFNSGWEQIISDYNLSNGNGLDVSLKKGELYYIRVTQYSGACNYTLTVK